MMNFKEKEELDRWRMGERHARERQPRDHRHSAMSPQCCQGNRELHVAEAQVGVAGEKEWQKRSLKMPGGRS